LSEAAVGDLRQSREAAQQLALLPESGDEADAAIAEAAERRGAGRPAGAVNRATRQMRDYILRNFTDPAVGLASSGLCSTLASSVIKARSLASQLGCKPLEALDFMRRCSEGVMPYTHSKQPLAVQLNGRIAQLHIGLGAEAGERLGGDGLAQLLDAFVRASDALPAEDLAELENDAETST